MSSLTKPAQRAQYHTLCKASSSIPPPRPIPTNTIRFIQRLILPTTPPPSTQTEKNSQSTAGNNNPSTRLIPRLLRAKEEVRCKPMRYRRDAVCNCYQGRSFCSWAWDDGCFPGYLDLKVIMSPSILFKATR